MDEELDFTKLRYVIYARKSTDDPGRQPRSIEDQITECKELATRLGLHIIGSPLVETKSAKKPNQRPIFTQMLKDLKKGLYDGVIAWNPDRLARNMREGGEIIDMIDEDQIKDLKFVTHHFSKDANGKMLLGLAFVLSKQYSDNLSQNVKRGNRRKFERGESHIPKHGYVIDDKGTYQPDGKNFELIETIWKQRSEGLSFDQIVKFLDDNGYSKHTKTGKIIKISKQILTDLFKDPFYYGVLVKRKTNEKIDLKAVYNFRPATSEEIYNKIQALAYRKIYSAKKPISAFYPLKKMIVCFYCGNNMYVGASTGRNERYLNARCDNELCPRAGKSVRMLKVFEFIYKFLEDGLNFTEDDYRKYYNNLSTISDQNRQKINIEIHSKQGILKTIDLELDQRALGMIKFEKDSNTWKINDKRLGELGKQKQDLENQLEKLNEKLIKPDIQKLTLSDFLNLSKNAAMIVKSANSVIKDLICRKIFLNLTIDNEKVLSYQAKEPFASLIKQRELLVGRGKRT